MNGDQMMTPPAPRSRGSLIGSIIVVIILIAGAIYIFSSRQAEGPVLPAPAGEQSATTLDENNAAPAANTASSDELTDLEAEATADPFAGLDAEVEGL